MVELHCIFEKMFFSESDYSTGSNQKGTLQCEISQKKLVRFSRSQSGHNPTPQFFITITYQINLPLSGFVESRKLIMFSFCVLSFILSSSLNKLLIQRFIFPLLPPFHYPIFLLESNSRVYMTLKGFPPQNRKSSRPKICFI